MVELFTSVNWFAVFTATFIYFMLGALWYSPVLFANTWIKLRNIPIDETDDPNPVIFFYSFILQLIAVVSLALFIAAMSIGGAANGAIIGFGAGAGILFTLTGTTGIFSDLNMKLHVIDNGYHVLGLTLAGTILGWWG